MKEIYKNTWAELDQGVRFFLLTGTEKALVIDTGMNGPDVRGIVSAHTGLPVELLNTHAKETVEREVIPRLTDGAKRILAGENEGRETERFGKKIRVCDAGVSRFLCGLRQ